MKLVLFPQIREHNFVLQYIVNKILNHLYYLKVLKENQSESESDSTTGFLVFEFELIDLDFIDLDFNLDLKFSFNDIV